MQKADPLFVALTKREGWVNGALPYTPTIWVIMCGGVVFLATKSLTFGFLVTSIGIGALCLMVRHDQDLPTILALRLRLWCKAPVWNSSYWGARSYEP